MWFTSDNAGPAHPAVLEAVARANEGFTPGYGGEAAMARVTARIREIFEAPEAMVHLVGTGTAANALALACLVRPWETVFCHHEAHVEVDECAAPEFFADGAKLTTLPGAHGRIEPAALSDAISARRGVENVAAGALSLTNATEAGTLYTPGAVRELTGVARAAGLPCHMDGARFANALAALGCSPADLTWRAGIDVLCLGGTKNGCLGVEAVVFFDPARGAEFERRRKRGGHLFSKHRFLAAQMEAYLEGGLWLDLAARANAAARLLAEGLAGIAGARLLHPCEANAVFVALPRARLRAAEAKGARFYLWDPRDTLDGPDEDPVAARFVCDWSKTGAEVAALLAALG
ncbi:threonine aldolase family protein [Amaricoccus solimangrovi]|uniref:Low specificity L-threonine aldolase n=1 Tax=Amaricoccus solimangrovi TaxID=2589815 RepID=A0A501WFW9_9RHOB|nr:beta-eliminating lyase-related protein [Amaricoccus solimangrovi]TPE47375.1 low specificity L-threonine aldolase [Amaricoccus solimangrovi]